MYILLSYVLGFISPIILLIIFALIDKTPDKCGRCSYYQKSLHLCCFDKKNIEETDWDFVCHRFVEGI